MFGDRSIAFKLILVITLCTSLIFTLILGYSYYRSKSVLQRELENNARNLALSSVNRVEAVLASVTRVTEGLARSLENGRYSHQDLLALLKDTLADTPEIYGSCAAFEPDTRESNARPYAPYFFRNQGKIAYNNEDSFQYLRQDWYQISRELGRTEWTEPYYGDNGSNILMASCSVPFHETRGGARRVKGVVVSDISLEWLTATVASIKVLKSGYAFLLSRNGTIVTHPSREMIMNETVFSLAEARNDPGLRALGRKMIRGGSDFIPYTDLYGRRCWLYYAPIPSVGWTLAVVFPEAELLAQVKSLSLTGAIMGLAGILLLTLAVVFIARSITTPLRSLAAATHELAAGNFDLELPPVRSNDEVGLLAHDFQAMKESLKEYIRNLTETTAAKERIQSELKVATDIQASLLPRIFPAFPERPEFDIFASMDPAKEVGGDFYDFFFIDDTSLCFLIADVSDKGVPAALYMMVAKTLLKSEAQRLGEPDKILSSVNNILAADNDSCMFATVFCAILDTTSGEVRFANAGHNPPLTIDSTGIGYLCLESGFVLGPMSDIVYTTQRLTMQPGDTLFLYTDGVTEAKNRDEELYGEPQLLDALRRGPRDDLTEMIHFIRAEVTRHADGAPQSDDITMVAITYRGAAPGDGGEREE
jgi:sigma-B regulation protein RsbU (phosphoserine phosphatase)